MVPVPAFSVDEFVYVPKLSGSTKYRIETVAIDEFHGSVVYTLQSYFSPVSARIRSPE
jgi:hypothetical protein